jgi:cytochrome b561
MNSTLSSSIVRYGLPAQLFHWLAALLIAGLVATNLLRENAPLDSPERLDWLHWHMSLGITLFVLTIARIVWAKIVPPPEPVPAPQWSLIAARIGHVALNLTTLFVPIFGYLRVATKDVAASFFGLPIPSITGAQSGLHEVMELLHGEPMMIVLVTLITLHVGAAIWHQYIRRDGALLRMLPWG